MDAAEETLKGSTETLTQYQRIRESECLSQFLLSLNESFLSLRTQVLAMTPPPNLCRVFQLVIQDESQSQVGLERAWSVDAMAFVGTPTAEHQKIAEKMNEQLRQGYEK